MKLKIHIGIADDHSLVRDGLTSILNSYPSIKILFEVSNGVELLAALKNHRPDVLLLDIAMPLMDGVTALPLIKSSYPEIKVIVVSMHTEPQSVIEYIKLGAAAFLPKDCGKQTFIEAINSVHTKGSYFEKSLHELLNKNNLFPKALIKERKLSDKELAILKLICERKTLKEISTLLNVNLKTVSSNRHTIFKKTGTNDENGLIAFAKQKALF